MRRLLLLMLAISACSSSPDERVFDCGMSGGPESWFRCEYTAQEQCLCGPRVYSGTALVCVPGTHGDWGMAADRVRAEIGPPTAVIKCGKVGDRNPSGLPNPTIIVGASVGATGGDWPATEPQSDCLCD